MRQRGMLMNNRIMYKKEERTAVEGGSSSGAGLRPYDTDSRTHHFSPGSSGCCFL